jgi:hypothetical protein
VVSYEYDINIILNMSGLIEGKTQDANIAIAGSGASNITVNEQKMTANMDITSPGQAKMSMPIDVYSMNGWAYAKISVPFAGEQWIKTKVDLTSFDAKDDIQQILELLQTATEVNITGSEDVNGIPCYVLAVKPDSALLSKVLNSLQQTTGTQDSQQANKDLSKYVKNLTIREWIAKDTNLLKKSELSTTLTMTGTDINSSAKAGDTLTIDISVTTTITQYNKKVTITLPPESQNAQEIAVPK